LDLTHESLAEEDRAVTVTPVEGSAAPAEAATAPSPMKRRQFRTAATKSKLSADEANRQGRVVRIAFELMGRDASRVFLNEADDELGGRPLDVATASADGMQAVEAAIAARGAPRN
jgi:photosystem II stability/assembly factor-like uncharacterized protein